MSAGFGACGVSGAATRSTVPRTVSTTDGFGAETCFGSDAGALAAGFGDGADCFGSDDTFG